MNKPIYPSTDALLDALNRRQLALDDPGFCLACGAEAEGVEPDARRYPCAECGKRQVYGVEEVLMMTNA